MRRRLFHRTRVQGHHQSLTALMMMMMMMMWGRS
jgi:hypothetical protein